MIILKIWRIGVEVWQDIHQIIYRFSRYPVSGPKYPCRRAFAINHPNGPLEARPHHAVNEPDLEHCIASCISGFTAACNIEGNFRQANKISRTGKRGNITSNKLPDHKCVSTDWTHRVWYDWIELVRVFQNRMCQSSIDMDQNRLRELFY